MTPEEQMSTLSDLVAQLQEQLAQRDAVIAQLQEQLRQLQARVDKDSQNSHVPPSSDRFVRQPKSLRSKRGKKPGGQAGHQGHSLKQVASPNAVQMHRVECCESCHQDLREVACLQVERRQVIEVPSQRVEVIEHQAERTCGPHCQSVSQAAFPQAVVTAVQYGSAYMGLAVYLVTQQLLPYQRACDLLFDLVGHPVSPASLQQWGQRCSQHLDPVETQIKTALSQAPVVHQDETGLYVAGKRQWLHVTSTLTLTHYAVHAKRGQEALHAIGILRDFTGVSVHDGWRSSWHFACQHALCNVHILREVTFLHEEQQQEWAGTLKTVVLDLKAAVTQARSEGRSHLHGLEEQDWKAEYQRLLQEGLHIQSQEQEGRSPPDASSKRGRRKHSAAHNLLTRLGQDQEAVVRFVEDFAVPFDNNLAERDVRMVKVQQKVSGCFRSQQGAGAFARVRGYLSTLRKQGRAVLTALQQTMLGHPVFPSFEVAE